MLVFVSTSFFLALNPEIFTQVDMPDGLDPEDFETLELGITMGISVFFGLLIGIGVILTILLQNYGIHLFSKYVFKGKAPFKALINETFKVWTTAILVYGIAITILVFRNYGLLVSDLFQNIARAMSYILIVLLISNAVRKVYEFAFWKGLITVVTTSIIYWGLGQLL
jgi:hypothetical protein